MNIKEILEDKSKEQRYTQAYEQGVKDTYEGLLKIYETRANLAEEYGSEKAIVAGLDIAIATIRGLLK